MSHSTKPLFLTLLALFAAVFAAPASSQPADQFYKGKTVTIIVGISPGGGYDQYARLLARHLSKHIPGAPTIVVRNVPGAGSLTSVLQIDSILPTDGTHIVAFNAGLLNDSMVEGSRARVRFNEFSWIGSMARDLRVCFTWKTSKVRSWEDLQSRQEVVFGAPGANSNSANGIAIIKNLFNVNIRTIFGYPGNTEMNLAIERGEIDGSCVSWSSLPEHWVAGNSINVLNRLSPNSDPAIPDSAKFVGDLVATPEQRSVVDVLVSSGELARPFIISQKTPPDRLEVLRSAFSATMVDPDFLSDAARQRLLIDAVDGRTAEAIAGRLYGLPPDVAEKARAVLRN